MKKLLLLSLILIFTLKLFSTDEISLNFFNYPQINTTEIENNVNKINKFILSDKSKHINIFTGRILKQSHNDSLLIYTLNKLVCNLAAPTDYTFENPVIRPDFKLLALNIKNKRLPIRTQYIIKSDSMKIAILSVYTPDIFIKQKLSDNAEFRYDFIKLLKEKVRQLKKPENRINVVILISNLSKPIDKVISKKIKKIDVILSSDYKKRAFTIFSNKTRFYSVLSNNGKVGKLQIIYHKGKIRYRWQILRY